MRRFFVVCLLLALPLAQARAVFVCPMHAAASGDDCFCPVEHRVPAAPEPAAFDTSCCSHAVVEPDHTFVVSAAHDTLPTPKNGHDDPGSAPVIATPFAILASRAGRFAPSRPVVAAPRDESRLYLETARLRL
jgi:hypothetical protein